MTNDEKFNVLLNCCAYLRQIYNALLALAEDGFTERKDQRECMDPQ